MSSVTSTPSGEFSILFTSAGRRVSLLRMFRDAMAELGLRGRIIAADLGRTAPAGHVADLCVRVPRVDAPEYAASVKQICSEHRINLVVPLIDTELHILAPHRADFAKMGVQLLVSSPEVTRACLDKRSTHDFFVEVGVRTPALFEVSRTLTDRDAKYPLFLKPDTGSSSVGARRVDSPEELAFFANRTPNAILQEYIKGDEYTMDVLVDFEGRTRCVVPRLRIETRAGEISKGMTVKNPTIIDATRRVVDGLRTALGCVTVQCFMTAEQSPVFIEINPRFGGGFPLAHAAGAAYPRWLIEWAIGRESDMALDSWTDGVVMLRYDEAIFLRREDIE